MVLYLQTNEFLKGLTNGYGIRMTLQRPQTYPFPYDQGIFVPAAMETSIGLKMVRNSGKCSCLIDEQYTKRAIMSSAELEGQISLLIRTFWSGSSPTVHTKFAAVFIDF